MELILNLIFTTLVILEIIFLLIVFVLIRVAKSSRKKLNIYEKTFIIIGLLISASSFGFTLGVILAYIVMHL